MFSNKSFKGGLAWIVLLLGVAFYFVGFFYFKDNSVWKEIFLKLADVLVIGVILGYLSNAAQFFGIFKKDLIDIIYGKEFLRKRNDLPELWETISKEMFKNKFPSIHSNFFNVMKGYFPDKEVSYYDEHETHIKIDWVDKERGTIKVTEIVSFDLISDTKDVFNYPMKTWTRVSENGELTCKLTDITINGISYGPVEPKSQRDNKHGEICSSYNIKLEGRNKYEIKYTREKVYNINDDYYIGFRSLYILRGMRVCLDHPEDIETSFVCRGTPEDFIDINNSKTRVEKKYRGLVLPRQGYIFVLRRIN